MIVSLKITGGYILKGKKLLSIVFAALMAMSSVHIQAESSKGAVPPYLGETRYWYSDKNYVGHMGNGVIKVRVRASHFSAITMVVLYPFAVAAWAAGNYASYRVVNDGSYDIFFGDISRNYANQLGIPSTVLGFTTYSNSSDFTIRSKAIGEIKHGNILKRIYRMEKSFVYLIHDSNSSNFSFDKLRCIVNHEWGHALGYFGHDIHATSKDPALMYPTIKMYDSWGLTGSTLRDRRHLDNGYKFF